MIGVLLVVQQSMENISKSKKQNEEGIKHAAHRSTTTMKRRSTLKLHSLRRLNVLYH
jgi:hypothetical protein